jgi:hypothetical protein
MRRREFIFLVGGAAAGRPLLAEAEPAVLPVVAYISAASPGQTLAALRQALAEAGYVDGRNVTIEFHTAEGQYDRLPTIIAELVRRQVACYCRKSYACGTHGKSCNPDDTNLVRRDRRSRKAWSRREPRAAGWECDRC